jgi:RNA polymerase sigma-70 factor, ECF subfamily
VQRIGAGDPDAERTLVERFGRGVRAILRNLARDLTVAEDLYQETFRVLVERLRSGAVRDPSQLNAFVASLARNLATEHFRRVRKEHADEAVILEGIADPSPSAPELITRAEQAALVRRILEELPVERDRDLLRRFYLGQESKERIQADHGLTSLQFNRVLHRARERFRELWMQRSASGNGRGR